MLYLKIMNAVRGNDDHPRQGYRLLSGVKEVIFREPYEPETSDQSGKASAFIWLHDCPEPVILDLDGSAYVMNDKGNTISRFEVFPQNKPCPWKERGYVGLEDDAMVKDYRPA